MLENDLMQMSADLKTRELITGKLLFEYGFLKREIIGDCFNKFSSLIKNENIKFSPGSLDQVRSFLPLP